MFGGSLSPPGFERTSAEWKRCALPTVLRRGATTGHGIPSTHRQLNLPKSTTETGYGVRHAVRMTTDNLPVVSA